jgi:hypothetical protein
VSGERRFGRREALVAAATVGVLAVLVAGALPGLRARAWREARSADCRRNLRFIGAGLAQWRTDHAGNYPSTVEYGLTRNMICNAWGRIYSEGYSNDPDIYICAAQRPSRCCVNIQDIAKGIAEDPVEKPWTENAAALYGLLGAGGNLETDYDADYCFVLESSYNYDNGRIDRSAAAGRIVAGDGLWRQWMRNAGTPSLDSLQDWQNYAVAPNHVDGANVLYHDGAAEYIKIELNRRYWIPHQTDAALDGSTVSLETEPDCDTEIAGPDRPCLGDRYDWVRQGIIQNERIEEDGVANSADEHDDIYAIEGVDGAPDTEGEWWMLSEFQFETGILVGGVDWVTDGHGRITDTKGSTKGMVRVAKSKTDASIQPLRHYRPGTGRPDADADCEFGVPLDGHSAGDIWDY